MANSLKHSSVGTSLSQTEYEAIDGHVVESQATGDILYAESSSSLQRLGIGSTGDYLRVASGKPDWQATTSITALGTIATGVWQGTAIGASYVATLNQSTTGNAATATALATGRTINGVSFDGTGNITVPAAAGTLTGSTLASGVVTTSVTTVGALNSGSITSGFGAIDVGSSNLTATGTISLGATDFNDNNITNVGSIAIDKIIADSGISIGIGTDPSANQLLRVGGTHTNPTANGVALGLFPAITTATGSSNYSIARFNASVTTYAASDTYTNISTLMLDEPSITLGSGSSVTTAATLTINDAPTEATNNYALFVDSGAIRLDGAISLGTDHGDDGQQLTSGGDDAACDWTAASSLREHKNIGKEANRNDALRAMLDSKAYHFHYKDKLGTGDSATEYVGVMADDAPWAMHYKGRIVNPVNSLGYTVLSIQALHDKITKLETAIVTMRDE